MTAGLLNEEEQHSSQPAIQSVHRFHQIFSHPCQSGGDYRSEALCGESESENLIGEGKLRRKEPFRRNVVPVARQVPSLSSSGVRGQESPRVKAVGVVSGQMNSTEA